MILLVSVTVLRKGGVRVEKRPSPVEGYLRTEQGSSTVSVVSNTGGIPLAGPLFEPRLVRASLQGLLLLGFEKEGNAAVVQEWLVTGMPLPTWLEERRQDLVKTVSPVDAAMDCLEVFKT